MSVQIAAQKSAPHDTQHPTIGGAFNLFVIGLMAFLTVVDLFATQAILPSLAKHYGVSPGAMGAAVNASTLGMAASGLLVAMFGAHIERRLGIVVSLILLALPTALLAHAPSLTEFAILRIIQGLLMSAAFTLTLAYLGERCTAVASAGAFAAYVTGNVASNLIGRLIAASAVQTLGLAWNFYLFAGLNIVGALLAMATIRKSAPLPVLSIKSLSPFAALKTHLINPALCISFAIGFFILFAFIGTFTFVNFVLVQPPLSLSMMSVGLVYFVFAPSIVTTPLAGALVSSIGTRATLWVGLGAALLSLPLLLSTQLPLVLTGMVMIAIGIFLAQATATGFVSRTATTDRGAASGLYLASYFLGGLAGSALLGALFDSAGWQACVMGVAVALSAGLVLSAFLRDA